MKLIRRGGAPCDLQDCETRSKILYWSTVELYRQSLSLDGTEPQRIKDEGGLNPRSVRRIATAYNVVRGIPGASKEDRKKGIDKNAKWYAEKLNTLKQTWPAPLIERANACANLTRDAEKKGKSKDFQASAVTKLMWFLKPEGWTMFDDLAATGLGIKKQIPDNSHKEKKATSVSRMLAYYQVLDLRDFTERAAELNEIINKSGISIHGERLIDKYLMASTNTEWQDNWKKDGEIYLKLVPRETQKMINDLAKKISKKYEKGLLPTLATGKE